MNSRSIELSTLLPGWSFAKRIPIARSLVVAFAIFLTFIPSWNASAQTLIHAFDLPPANPNGELVESGGFLYGTTFSGGANHVGTIFRVDRTTGTVATAASFDGANGAKPRAGLLAHGGSLYGTTTGGGASDSGAVFRFDPPTGALTVVASFNLKNGAAPQAGLIVSGSFLYGMTSGNVFRIDLATGALTPVAWFEPYYGSSGSRLLESGGYFYGTTRAGGEYGLGSVFRVDPSTGNLETVVSFHPDINGRDPFGGLVEFEGSLYGTTTIGGAHNRGIVFRIDPATGSLTRLSSFSAATGERPSGTLIRRGGSLYGTTSGGGSNETGTVFRVDPSTGVISTLASFDASSGAYPNSGLMESDGSLFGVTTAGGSSGLGTVFRFDFLNETLAPVASFRGFSAAYPYSALLADGGVLYGTTYIGGAGERGTVFSLHPLTRQITTLATFDGANGANPRSELLKIGDVLFGTTEKGGAIDRGTLFRLDLATGTLTTLVTFSGGNGANPYGGVVESGGSLFGTTYRGGVNDRGTVFRFDLLSSTLTTLVAFNGEKGANPYQGLTLSGGFLYGTTEHGGLTRVSAPKGVGTVFRLDPVSGTFMWNPILDFVGGWFPRGKLLASGGWLYGTTIGSSIGAGTVFRIDPQYLALKLIWRFNSGSLGLPWGGLVEHEGFLYGTTTLGSPTSRGTIFRLNPAEAVPIPTIVGNFDGGNGSSPRASLVESSGTFYGTAALDGPEGGGGIFRLKLSATPTMTSASLSLRGGSISVATLGVVKDADSAAGSLTVTPSSLPAGVRVTDIVNTNGTITARVSVSCDLVNFGFSRFHLKVQDEGGMSSTALVNLFIPSAQSPGSYSESGVASGAARTIIPFRAPGDYGSISTIVASAPGFTGGLSVDGPTGIISITNAGPSGRHSVTLTATDHCGATATTSFALTVSGPGGFGRGDANGDGAITAADIFFLINALFGGGSSAVGNGDANNDGVVNASDVFFLIYHLFSGGPAPTAPA